MVTFQGTSPVPSDAVVLFGGNNLEQWISDKDGGKAMWEVRMAFYGQSEYGRYQDETKIWIVPAPPRIPYTSCGGRQRSGQGQQWCFLPGKYEVQILDNYNNSTPQWPVRCGLQTAHSFGQRLQSSWWVADVWYYFHCPVLIRMGWKWLRLFHGHPQWHSGSEPCWDQGYYGVHWSAQNDAHGMGSIKLQDHGNPMSFRNVWVREL